MSWIVAVMLAAVMASPLPSPSPSPSASPPFGVMTATAQQIDAAAKAGDWTTAQNLETQLENEWAAQRPSMLHGFHGRADAQRVDGALQLVHAAVWQRYARNVHDACTNFTSTLQHLRK